MDWKHISLRSGVNGLEDAVITLSGPALAISGIIAGVDLVTGGHILAASPVLALAWAICLLLTLDFQVLALGARAHQVYVSSEKGAWRKIAEIVIAAVIAGAISYVSIQMQAIIARSNGTGIPIDVATMQLGINPIALTWERSALVLVLIFMSGWFRGDQSDQGANTGDQTATNKAIEQLAEQVQQLAGVVTQITTTVTEVKTTVSQISLQGSLELPERTPVEAEVIGGDQNLIGANAQGEQGDQDNGLREQIRLLLMRNPQVTDRELASLVGCSSSTANKWRRWVAQTKK